MNISKLCIFQCRCIFYFSCGGVVVVVGGDGGGGTTKFSLVKMVEGGRRTPRGVYIEPLYPHPSLFWTLVWSFSLWTKLLRIGMPLRGGRGGCGPPPSEKIWTLWKKSISGIIVHRLLLLLLLLLQPMLLLSAVNYQAEALNLLFFAEPVSGKRRRLERERTRKVGPRRLFFDETLRRT